MTTKGIAVVMALGPWVVVLIIWAWWRFATRSRARYVKVAEDANDDEQCDTVPVHVEMGESKYDLQVPRDHKRGRSGHAMEVDRSCWPVCGSLD
jgi:hypothetical protein